MLALYSMYIDCPVNQYGPVLHLLTILGLCISAIVHMVAFVNLLLKKMMMMMMMQNNLLLHQPIRLTSQVGMYFVVMDLIQLAFI